MPIGSSSRPSSTSCALWESTSPYKFYHYWYKDDDRDVEAHLKHLAQLPRPDIEAQMKTHKKDPIDREAQGKLAVELTTMVHGKKGASNATAVKAILYSDLDP